jgi:prepilin-type N-terminal cleavage/methylation domain-containing protein
MKRSARAPRRLGYTLIEVMVGVAISAIGISGIVLMQSATVRSNQDAHETQVATSFARTWLERNKRDALLWTGPGTLQAPGAMFATRNTALANSGTYFSPTEANQDVWAVPIPLTNAPESAGANYQGVDVGAVDNVVPFTGVVAPVRRVANGDIYYCTNTKFVQVHTSLGQPDALRATVRVWWQRKASLNEADYTPGLQAVRAGGCESFLPTSADLQDPQGRFRVVYLSTVVRWTSPI